MIINLAGGEKPLVVTNETRIPSIGEKVRLATEKGGERFYTVVDIIAPYRQSAGLWQEDIHTTVVVVPVPTSGKPSLPPLEQLVLARWKGEKGDPELMRWGFARRMPVVDGISRWERWIESDDTADWIHWDDPELWSPLPDTSTMNRTKGASA